jgi:hypothetical protein
VDLRRILATREPLYAKANITINTSGRTIDQSLQDIVSSIPSVK